VSDGDRPGERTVDYGPAGRALSTAVHGNSTAFGFSLTMTGTFGMVTSAVGTPKAWDVLLYSLGAALAIGALEGLVTQGFRLRPVTSPSEVRMLGTALNLLSVGIAVGVALGVAEAIGGYAAWPVCALCSATTYVLAEAGELWLAARIQEARGDPRADEEEAAD